MLGEMNWTGLNNYNVKPEDMSDGQDFLFSQFKNFYMSYFTKGLVSRERVSIGAGLKLDLPASVVVFLDGSVAPMDSQEVSLDAADPTNPRVDRIEVYFEKTSERSGVNEASEPVVISYNYKATIRVLTGTPGVNPSPQGVSANCVSVCTVRVPAGANSLLLANLDQSKNSRDYFEPKSDEIEVTLPDSNNALVVGDLQFDKSVSDKVSFDVEIFRSTDDVTLSTFGKLTFLYNSTGDSWDAYFTSVGDDMEIVFSINENGYVELDISAVGGANHVGEISFSNLKISKR